MNSPKVEPLSKELAKIYRKCADVLTVGCVESCMEVTGDTTLPKFGEFFNLFEPATMKPEEKRLALYFMAAMVEAGDA